MGKQSRGLLNERDRIVNRIEELEEMGVAESGCWLSPTKRKQKSGKVKVYWRLNTETPAGTKTQHLGDENSDKYKEVAPLIERRNEVTELNIQLGLLEELLDRQQNWEG